MSNRRNPSQPCLVKSCEGIRKGALAKKQVMFHIRIALLSPKPFDYICMAEIILKNKGKVGFEYSVLDAVQASADNPPPGVPLTLPATVSNNERGVGVSD